MYSNGIDERQNQELNIMKLAAMRQLYSTAKSIFNIKIFACTGLVVLGNLFSIFKAQSDLLHFGFLFIKIISIFVPFIAFDNWISRKKELAAIIQEEFDNNVIKTNWNTQNCGSKGIYNQEININKNKYENKFKNDNWKSKLYNWYSTQYSEMPLNIGRIYCQSTNINWDKELRMKFKKLLYTLLISILFILFAIASIINKTFLNSLEYILLPFVPLIILLIQTIIENNKTISDLVELRNELNLLIIEKDNPNATDEKLLNLSNRLQEKIYKYRKSAFLIPDIVYTIDRGNQENLSNSYANMEKQKFNS